MIGTLIPKRYPPALLTGGMAFWADFDHCRLEALPHRQRPNITTTNSCDTGDELDQCYGRAERIGKLHHRAV